MMHANGISYEGDVLDLALAAKLLVRSGAWFRRGDEQLAQGSREDEGLPPGASGVHRRTTATNSRGGTAALAAGAGGGDGDGESSGGGGDE